MTTPIPTNRPASTASTPEEYFTPRPNPEEEIPIDALLRTLARAQGVLLLVQDSGENLNHAMLLDSLDCIDGLLTQAITMVHHSIGIEVKS